jgi:Na+/melibiose symporter-like transporter
MPRLPQWQKFCYSLGQFAWASKDVSFHYFLFFYYAQLLGLSASLAGLAALLALIADGISDPIIGQISDNWRNRGWGRRHPFMLAAIIPYGCALLALFNPPDGLSQGQLFAWYLAFAVLVRSLLTLFTVPHMALGAELSDDYNERTGIATYRNIMGYIGGLSIQVLAWFLVIPAAVAAGDPSTGYRNVGLVAVCFGLFGMAAAWFGTRGRIPHLIQISTVQQDRPWYLAFTDILSLLRYHSARVLLLGTFFVVMQMGVANTLLIHINTFFWGFRSEQTGVFMLVIFLSLFPASWLAVKGVELYGKRRAIVACTTLAALVFPIVVVAHVLGLTPPVGSTALLVLVCSFVVVQQSFAIGAINIGAGMLPDVVDEMELSTGLRQEGILNSGLMLVQKVMFGLGSFFAGLIIDYSGVNTITTAAEMTDSMFSRLGWIYGPGLALIMLLGAWIYSHYRLDRQRLTKVQEQLVAARA